MIRSNSIVACVLAASLLCGRSPAQTTTRPATQPAGKVVRLKHLAVDLDKRQVVVQATVSLKEGFLEFLLCTQGTKDYESLLATKALPSSLHAALTMLGLDRGKPAQWTTPAGGKPVFVPPKGAMLEIVLRWKDPKGAPREAAATDWLLLANTKKKPKPTRWAFVGSALLDDGRYWADVEGHHVSLANFASSVIDVPFESSDKNAMLEFTANPAVVPAKGTPVEVVIAPVKDAQTAADARVAFTVDAFGRVEMDGRRLSLEDVPTAVRKFLSRHSKTAAVVRIDQRALVYDRERLKAALAEAGLSDVTFRVQALADEILPRTPREVGQALQYWKDQLAQAGELLGDPGEDVAAVLKHVERRQQQIKSVSALWADYATRLRALLDEYKARRPKAPGGR